MRRNPMVYEAQTYGLETQAYNLRLRVLQMRKMKHGGWKM